MPSSRTRRRNSFTSGMCEPERIEWPTMWTPSSRAALAMRARVRRMPSETTSMPKSRGHRDLLVTVAMAIEAGLAQQHLEAVAKAAL